MIGHSHGGTVATLALKDFDYHKNVSGIGCLSTPFFHIRIRPHWQARFVAERCAPVASAGVILASTVSYVDAIGIAIVTVLVVAVMAWRLKLRACRSTLDQVRQIEDADLSGCNLFIARIAADEASLAISAMRLGQSVFEGLETYLGWPLRHLPVVRPIAGLVGASLLFTFLAIASIAEEYFSPLRIAIMSVLLVSMVPFYNFTYEIRTLFHSDLPPWDPLMHTALQVSAEETPPGIWTVHQFSSVPQAEGRMLGHSSTYSHPGVIAALGRWITASVISRRPTQAHPIDQ